MPDHGYLRLSILGPAKLNPENAAACRVDAMIRRRSRCRSCCQSGPCPSAATFARTSWSRAWQCCLPSCRGATLYGADLLPADHHRTVRINAQRDGSRAVGLQGQVWMDASKLAFQSPHMDQPGDVGGGYGFLVWRDRDCTQPVFELPASPFAQRGQFFAVADLANSERGVSAAR